MREPAAVFCDPAVAQALRITTIEKNTNVYLECYRRLRQLIKDGILKPGDCLPSEHHLASIMCVGRTSLRTALSILYEDGYITTSRGKGSFVAGVSRSDRRELQYPRSILLPPDRVERLGTLSTRQGKYSVIRGDGFLNEKLSPGPGREIVLFEQMYLLNDIPAIHMFCYFNSDLFDFDPAAPYDIVGDQLLDTLRERATAAEYECAPIRMVNPDGLHASFPRELHSLVSTQYWDAEGHLLAFCKDYYNGDVIRFRVGIEK